MKGAIELFVSGSSKIDLLHTFQKIHWLHNKSQQKGSMQKLKLRCHQLKRNITWLVINAKIFQVTEI